MKAEAEVKTTVVVDLGDFITADLIAELEDRGHAVDADSAFELDTLDLIDELSRRQSDDFARMPLDKIINVLERFNCPANLIKDLRAWESQPVPTKAKLETWLAKCSEK